MLLVFGSKTTAEVMAEFNTAIPMDESMALVPKGTPTLKDERLTIDYTMNVNGTPAPDAFGRLDGYVKNNGVGFVLTVGATADKANLLGKQKSILESTKFFAPKIPPNWSDVGLTPIVKSVTASHSFPLLKSNRMPDGEVPIHDQE